MKPVLSIGMMSGTSVDGAVDAAAIVTDGDCFVERRLVQSHQYEAVDGSRPIHHCTKAAEIAFRQAKGDMSGAAEAYPDALRTYVRQTFKLSNDSDIESRTAQLEKAFFDGRASTAEVTLSAVIERSTEVHAEAAEMMLAALGDEGRSVQFVGYHGQTLYHAPFDHITVQVGDAQLLADRLGVPVVFDFRSNDVAHGGQGAPLAPVYHRALVQKAGFDSAAIVNLGGTANVTMVNAKNDTILGFDTGPANGLIDKYVKEKASLGLDTDSLLALEGKISERALAALIERSILLKDGRSYLKIPPPKSLDIRDYTYDLPEFTELSLEDGCATLNAFSAECIAMSLEWFAKAGFETPKGWILCGGGAQSPHLGGQIRERVQAKGGTKISLLSADEAGWSAQGMEAELFAFLAVRSVNGMPLTFPGTTGAPRPLQGGKLFQPRSRRS